MGKEESEVIQREGERERMRRRGKEGKKKDNPSLGYHHTKSRFQSFDTVFYYPFYMHTHFIHRYGGWFSLFPSENSLANIKIQIRCSNRIFYIKNLAKNLN